MGAVGKSGRNRRFQLQDPVLRPVEFFECLRSLCCVVCRLARLWSETGRRICEKEPAKVDHATPVGRQGVKSLEMRFSHACMNTVHEII